MKLLLTRMRILAPVVLIPLYADTALEVARGQRLFFGAEPLKGILVGHSSSMPAAAVRCVNCHSLNPEVPSGGTPLDRKTLLFRNARRGAPPSAYDEVDFCRILRTGVDPAFVVIGPEMPRYQISDAQCRSLWLYLIQGGGK